MLCFLQWVKAMQVVNKSTGKRSQNNLPSLKVGLWVVFKNTDTLGFDGGDMLSCVLERGLEKTCIVHSHSPVVGRRGSPGVSQPSCRRRVALASFWPWVHTRPRLRSSSTLLFVKVTVSHTLGFKRPPSRRTTTVSLIS